MGGMGKMRCELLDGWPFAASSKRGPDVNLKRVTGVAKERE